MQFTVFVESLEGGNRIVLAESDDADAAADLLYSLARAASGSGFAAGFTASPGSGGEATAGKGARGHRGQAEVGVPAPPPAPHVEAGAGRRPTGR